MDNCWPNAQFLASPNCNQRPENTDVSVLVIHNISLPPREFGGGYVEQFFQNTLNTAAHPYFATIAGMQVSAHCFIARTGEAVQFVPFDLRAWHAGVSVFDGCANCNDFSIGIELEGADDIAYTDQQYTTLTAVTRFLLQKYPKITLDRIVGHSDIAPNRKTDPGPAFDWLRYKGALRKK